MSDESSEVLGDTVSSNLLGEVVTWDLRTTEIAYSAVQDSLRAAGLDPGSAAELSPRSGFSRACKQLKQDRAIDKLEIDTKGLAKFQFTKKYMAAGMVEYDYECLIELDCNTGAISCPESKELEGQAQELLAYAMQVRTSQDVTRLVQTLFERHADLYPINPRKGVAYFVPAAHASFTAKVETFLKSLGGMLCRFPVPKGTAAGNASVKEAVQQGLATLLAELNDKVSAWDDSTRKSTMERASEEYEKVAYKVDAYAEYLESEQDKLREALTEAKAKLAAKIADLKPEDQPSAAA